MNGCTQGSQGDGVQRPQEVDALAGSEDGARHLPGDEGGAHALIQPVPSTPQVIC